MSPPETSDPQQRQFLALLQCSFIGNEGDSREYVHDLQQKALQVTGGIHHPNIKNTGHHGNYVGFEADPLKCAEGIAGIARTAIFFLSRALKELPDTIDQRQQGTLLLKLAEMNGMIADALQTTLKRRKPTPEK